jgi:hypothetical protein
MNSKMIRIHTVLRCLALGPTIAFGLLSILAIGCGGGGGGGGRSSIPTGITYDGNADPAVVTTTNAATLVNNAIGSGDAATAVGGTNAAAAGSQNTEDSADPSQGIGLSILARRLAGSLPDSLTQETTARSQQLVTAAQIVVDETVSCDSDTGSIRLSGTLDDNLMGTLTVDYNNCLLGDALVDGRATMRIDAVDLDNEIPTDLTISFNRLTVMGPTFDVASSGSVRSMLNLGTDTETLTVNLVTQDNISGKKTKADPLSIVIVYDDIFFPSSFSQTITGRVFDSVHGYVDIFTAEPLVFSTLFQDFPDSGELILTGDRNIRVTALSSTLVSLELDLDGDDVYEITAISQWAQLADEVNDDLGDLDSDGMHNSWEDVHALDPLDPADAVEDVDLDGFTNLEEYLAGTDPTDDSSFPSS